MPDEPKRIHELTALPDEQKPENALYEKRIPLDVGNEVDGFVTRRVSPADIFLMAFGLESIGIDAEERLTVVKGGETYRVFLVKD